MQTRDLIIIGAGPTGMACAIEAEKHNLDYLIIDKGSLVNSIRKYPTNMTFFSTAELLELDGMPFPTTSPGKRPTRNEALEYYIGVAQRYDLNLQLYTTVQSVNKKNDTFHIETDKGVFQSRYLVAATGYFDKPNTLNVPGEEQSHVSHYYDEAYPYVGLDVPVVGGSNSAVETILDLYRHGVNVKLIHRGDALAGNIKYWMKPDIENRIKEGSIPAYWGTRVKAIRETDMVLLDEQDKPFTVSADHVFLLTGYHPDADFLASLGININPDTLVPEYDEETLESNIKGLYVAGVILAGYKTAKIFIENGRHHGYPIIRDILSKTHKSVYSVTS